MSDMPIEVVRITSKERVLVAVIGAFATIAAAILSSTVLREWVIGQFTNKPSAREVADEQARAEVARLREQLVEAQRKMAEVKPPAIVPHDDSELREELEDARAELAAMKNNRRELTRKLDATVAETERLSTEALQKDAEQERLRKENELLRMVARQRSGVADRPAVVSFVEPAGFTDVDCMRRADAAAARVPNGTITKRESDQIFVAANGYNIGVQCIPSAQLVSFVVAGSDLATAKGIRELLRSDFFGQ